jgi:hypothetical protein
MQMLEVVLTQPLVILYLFYVLCLLPVLLWPDTPPPRRAKVIEAWAAFGNQGRPSLGVRLTPPPASLHTIQKNEKH